MYSFCCNHQTILSEDHREKLVHMKPNKPATKMTDEESSEFAEETYEQIIKLIQAANNTWTARRLGASCGGWSFGVGLIR